MMPEKERETASVEHNIEFQSVWPYIPILFLYALLIIFSVGFASASSHYVPWCSVIVVSGALLIVTTKLFSNVIRQLWIKMWMLAVDPDNEKSPDPMVFQSGTLDLLPIAEVFVAWLAMGVLFRMYPTIEIASQGITALWLLWLALLQVNGVRSIVHVRKSITLAFYLLMIYIPSDNGIATKLPWYTLLLKATITYLLFVLVSVEAASVRAITPRGSKRKRGDYLASTEAKIAQSSWVLITPNLLLIAAVLLGVVVVYRIFRNNRILDKKHDRKKKSRRKKKSKGKSRVKDSDVESASFVHRKDTAQSDAESGSFVQQGYESSEMVPWSPSGPYPANGYYPGYEMDAQGHFVHGYQGTQQWQ